MKIFRGVVCAYLYGRIGGAAGLFWVKGVLSKPCALAIAIRGEVVGELVVSTKNRHEIS